MTADPGLLSCADRARLLDRVGELAGIDRLMRERGTLAEPDEPLPLHRAGRDPAPGDPYGFGPWADCVSCRRRYRPAHESGLCYDCQHQLTGPAAERTTGS